jgi:hypothetical protein
VRRPLLRAALLGAAIVCGALAGEGLLVASGQLVAPPDVAPGALQPIERDAVRGRIDFRDGGLNPSQYSPQSKAVIQVELVAQKW